MAPGGAPNTPPNGPPPSQIQSAPNLVGFDPKQAVPQQPIYLQRNDYIGFNIISNQALNALRINYRWLTPSGEIKEGELDTLFASAPFLVNFPLYEGWLLSFAARVINTPAPGSWCFLQAIVFRGITPVGAIPNPHSLFWQGFVGFNASNGWPGTPAKEITDGPGVIRSITGTTPAAGAEISETVPTQRRWTLLSLRATLTTSAAVANRFPGFVADDSINTYYGIHSSLAQVASITNNYQVTPGNQFFNDTNSSILIPFPNILQLKQSHRIRSVTVGLQAADQWTAPQYLVFEWGQWDT